MIGREPARRGAFLLSVVGVGFLGMGAGAPRFQSLNRLEPGQWELRENGAKGSAPYRRVCVGDPRQLLQPRHAGQSCNRYVVDEALDHVTVAYNCPTGTGRTDLRVETSKLIQIHSNGVADSAPFALSLEGRRISDCP